ncbi:hypothetical protein MOX02_50670 [Methylobacterium oxalidis]|uniref:Uncharacterized protein n=1 Tax=Methylobacterium oxalidis TaxID=944322 RepID=A0A512JAW9_9HYPH|nr:hypothetical protein MOX02_50670 [Methylobacterium oxalidis]GLS64619.1 hypothetical protein GCM10007888_30000 [Methylobacterium oxalidis]
MPTALAAKANLQRQQARLLDRAQRSDIPRYRPSARGRKVEDLARYGGGLAGHELVEMAQAARQQSPNL